MRSFSFEQSRREEWANQTDAERVPISSTMIYLHLINKKGVGAPSPLDLPPPTQQP